MKKFLAGGAVILAGVTASVVSTFDQGEQEGRFNLCYVVDGGGRWGLVAGLVLEARADLEQDFSPAERGETAINGMRFTVRTVAITEAQANSINAGCRCFRVNDLENPTGLEAAS